MNHILKSALLLAMITFIACGRRESHHNADKHQSNIQLNNGNPWTANPETTSGIQAMRTLIANVPKAPQQADCQKLKTELKAEFDQIIQQCTMTGEAHNQLHNYLMPLAEEIDQLDAGTTSCQSEVMAINETLKEYNTYFK